MGKVITFGELMLRLSPEGNTRFLQTGRFDAAFGGSEANVAVCLANLGTDASFVTKLPDNAIGHAAVRELRSFGVDTPHIAFGGERMGLYYMEKGVGERGSVCIYDRKHSAIAEASEADFDWDEIFDGADWFHFSGITPALSDNAARLCMLACQSAKKRGLTVSCDLNYRSKLWTTEQAGRVMDALCRYADICFANEEDAADVFGIRADDTDVVAGKLNRAGYTAVARQLTERFGFRAVAVTLRTSLSASDNLWQAMLYRNGTCTFSREHTVRIVDRLGGGDSFAGALIYALREGMDDRQSVEFAVAASALAHTIEGDFCRVSVQEAMRLASGDASGRVRR